MISFVGMQFLLRFLVWRPHRAPKGDQPRPSLKNHRSSHVGPLTKTINWSIHVISSPLYIDIYIYICIYIYIYVYIYIYREKSDIYK